MTRATSEYLNRPPRSVEQTMHERARRLVADWCGTVSTDLTLAQLTALTDRIAAFGLALVGGGEEKR